MNIDDFLNGGEFDDLNDDQKKLIKSLFEMNNTDDVNSDVKFDKSGMFIHSLDSPEAARELQELIYEHNMKQHINFIDFYEGKLIEEIWTSENELIRVKRYYPFTYDNINMLPTNTRTNIYNTLLDQALEREDYELAAEIRDSIIINE